MALSNADKVRRYRERQRAAKHQAMLQPTPPGDLFRKPFFEFFSRDRQVESQYSQSLELGGLQPLAFEDDTGPEMATVDEFGDREPNNFFGEHTGSSLGKAEVLIGCLLASAQDLADWVNAYKIEELKTRLRELEGMDLPDAQARSQAFAKAAEIKRLLKGLEKTVRCPLKQWQGGASLQLPGEGDGDPFAIQVTFSENGEI